MTYHKPPGIYNISKDSKFRILAFVCQDCRFESEMTEMEYPDLDKAEETIFQLKREVELLKSQNENLSANLRIRDSEDSDSWKEIADGLTDQLKLMTHQRDEARAAWERDQHLWLQEAYVSSRLKIEIKRLDPNLDVHDDSFEMAPQRIYLEAKKQWGERSQVIAAVEEFAEGAAALCQYLNGKLPPDDLYPVYTELADVEIMSAQMRLYFDGQKIDGEKKMKLMRLSERLGLVKPPEEKPDVPT